MGSTRASGHHAAVTVDDLFDGWERAWSGRDPAAFAPLCDPEDVHYEDPLTPEPLESADAIAAHAQRLWAGFPDARMQRTGARAGRGAASRARRWKLLGTHTAELEGLTPTRRFVIVHGVAYRRAARGAAVSASARSSTSTTRRCSSASSRGPGTVGERALLMLRGFGLRSRSTLRALMRHFLTGRELSEAELDALLDRALELKASRCLERAGRRGPSRSSSSSRPPARACASRSASFELGGHPSSCAPTSCSSPAGESMARRRAACSAATSPRSACARAARSAWPSSPSTPTVPVVNMLSPRPPSVPGARGPADPAGGVRRPARPSRSPTSATATTSRARWPSSAAGRPRGRRRRAGRYQLEEGARRRARERAGRGRRQGADAVYTDVWVSHERRRGDGRRAPPGARALPPRRGAARPRHAGAVALHCLPAHPGEEINDRGPLRRSPAHRDQAENRRHAQKALARVAGRGRSADMPQPKQPPPQGPLRLARPARRVSAPRIRGLREQLCASSTRARSRAHARAPAGGASTTRSSAGA